ncbi:unnamed protein product [Rotaria magnacalcarata]|uniref:Uncharacterized protein n=2 Tax=Rotaria magnacalcarata TaxID=392030 RepID=A0A815XJH8_9BILA|nr:unnamed protein product [Rotaria magnacalcarata]CAF1577186.1 unnamed protein product [Rotaria magnacalcarata]CAF3989954.1 unnamed protein product [Rotaria magnacalcarata]CAF4092808.1 unnamed protein product [Rotaria magnacalcarata]
MVASLDYGYCSTPTGLLNIAEIVILIGALISVAFTSPLYCELADNLKWIYPDLNTLAVRHVFQVFAILCLTVTIIILLAHLYGIRYSGKTFAYLNQTCLIANVIMALMMLSIGICAALWEDKLRRTPGIIRRGYFSNRYQIVFNEETHPRPGAAAAAAAFALLAGILFIIEACTRPMLNTGATRLPTHSSDRPTYTVSPCTQRPSNNNPTSGDRIIPIETTTSQNRV